MNINRCVNCMEDMEKVSGTICPRCHFDNARAAEAQSPYAMRQNSILHGRYLIGNVLGQGGFGITYIAFDMVLSIKVAIKEYFPMGIAMRDPGSSNTLLWHSTQVNTEQRQSGQESFLKEARRIAKIDQIPSIVRVRDTFFDNDTAYIVMDYVEGITLKDKLIRGGSISFTECMRYLAPMMEGLAQVHKAGIIHRDISPDNIIIQANGSVKLLDLGAAKDISTGQGQQSQLVAKKGFSPLEQYTEAGQIGPWTDVYALCATIYYSVTGKMVPNALDRMGHEEISFPEGMKEPLEAHVRATLEAGLALEAGKRIQSVEEVLTRLRGGNPQMNMADGQPGFQAGKSVGKAEPKVNKPKKWGAWIGAAAAVFVLFVIVIAAAGGRSSRDEPVPTTEPSVAESEAAGTSKPENGGGGGTEESLPVVERLGASNGNMLGYGGVAKFPGEYEYYIAADSSALYICAYDQEDNAFYLGDNEKVCDHAGYITLGEDKVYFVATVDGEKAVCQMDKDGGNIRQLYYAIEGRMIRFLQYAQFSDQREYLYFLVENEADGTSGSLYRCNLENREIELAAEGEIFWYNLYGDSIYYTEFTYPSIALSKMGLDGEDKQILDTDRQFTYGFVAEDTLYAYSIRDEIFLACNLDGTQKSDHGGFYHLEIDYGYSIAYGEGWIYYTGKDGNVHKVRENGTGDSVLLEGICAAEISYSDSWLWVVDEQPTEKQHRIKQQVYFANKDGSTMFDVGEADYGWGLSTAREQDFQYEMTEDGEGVIITGYTGSRTSFEIPEEIAGKSVVAIGEKAFQESSLEEVGLPDGIKEIGSYAFYQCKELKFVGLPDGLRDINNFAFCYCGQLTGIDLPESLVHIGVVAFGETSLSQVYIPANVEEIWSGAFGVASDAGFTQFTISSENRFFEVYEGALYERRFDSFDDPIPGELAYLVAVPSGITAESFVIPDGVENIWTYAFLNCCWLGDVYVPRSIPKIDEEDFQNAILDSLTVSRDCKLPPNCSFARTINYY